MQDIGTPLYLLGGMIVLLIISLFVVYHLARTPPPNHQPADGVAGVAGWLLIITNGLLVIGPVASMVTTWLEFRMALSLYPELSTVSSWTVFTSTAWGAVLLCAGFSAYAGYGLVKRRTLRVVKIAQIALWVTGPVLVVALISVLPGLIYGDWSMDRDAYVALFRTLAVASIWTLYFQVSRRVKATYA